MVITIHIKEAHLLHCHMCKLNKKTSLGKTPMKNADKTTPAKPKWKGKPKGAGKAQKKDKKPRGLLFFVLYIHTYT
jgi:hypothetical protein